VTQLRTADDHVALRIDGNSLRNQRPVVALTGATPFAEQVPRRIELEHLRRREAARALGRLQLRSLFVPLKRVHTTMRDPNVVLCVNGDAVDRPENPHFRQWLGPQPIHFESRHLRAPRLGGHGFLGAVIQPEHADGGQ
jgi:hypothetical protein